MKLDKELTAFMVWLYTSAPSKYKNNIYSGPSGPPNADTRAEVLNSYKRYLKETRSTKAPRIAEGRIDSIERQLADLEHRLSNTEKDRGIPNLRTRVTGLEDITSHHQTSLTELEHRHNNLERKMMSHDHIIIHGALRSLEADAAGMEGTSVLPK